MVMLQTNHDGACVAAIIATFASVWRARAALQSISSTTSPDELFDIITKCLDCPWLVGCLPSSDRKSRRESRLKPPRIAPERVIYKSDGASHGQGQGGEVHAGWGAASWAATIEGDGAGPPEATAHAYMGVGISNNVAEYCGLLACLERAVRMLDPNVVFYVDSMLVARQMARYDTWACRCMDLVPLRNDCRHLGQALDNACIVWEVRHIFREYNQCADSLANEAVDDRTPLVQTPAW